MSRPAGYPDGPFLRTGLAVRHPTTESAAVMYSLIGSCKLNGIEPETWLRHVISVINTWPANCKRLARTVLIFTEKSDQLSRATDRVPGLPASPGYAQ